MKYDEDEAKFLGLWKYLVGKNLIASISLDTFKVEAKSKNVIINEIEEVEFGFSSTLKAIKIVTSTNKSAVFPRKIIDSEFYEKKIKPFKNEEKFWKEVDWFFPVIISRGDIWDAIKQSGVNRSNLNDPNLQEKFEQFFPNVYCIRNILPITIITLEKSSIIGKHLPVIKEAILSFFSGMRVTSVASLIPIIEDILNGIIGIEKNAYNLIEKVDHCIDKAKKNILYEHICRSDWVPEDYTDIDVLKAMNERIRVIESVREWLKNSFYKNTDNYQSFSGFNRHYFAHAKSEVWQRETNFFRAMGLIHALAFVECFALKTPNLSILMHPSNKKVESFWEEVMLCIETQKIRKILLQDTQIRKTLPFYKTASDDGVLLRKAMLEKNMNDTLLKRLAYKNWIIFDFGEPSVNGEYITVKARKNHQTIGIALLYSCASSNNMYKELATYNDFILYQGYPYNQDDYAYDINCYVGPLNAWLPPN
ncbi:hypothetical protein I2F17_10225 [Acinetobacter sp. B10A]|uniref:hypothetical protein n=1 Tax=Acinetobacter baretiae TaxID=2605383 RepID=UPI001B3C58DB|nr:hypothetical protein [Acinetobacter baretiae]MBF7686196.1 hypothetical protein [Acinetobacter baretiae]